MKIAKSEEKHLVQGLEPIIQPGPQLSEVSAILPLRHRCSSTIATIFDQKKEK